MLGDSCQAANDCYATKPTVENLEDQKEDSKLVFNISTREVLDRL